MPRQGLQVGSAATANRASASIWSTPVSAIAARSIARADSKDADPSRGTRSNDAASTTAAHRCAAGASPESTVIHPARTASGG